MKHSKKKIAVMQPYIFPYIGYFQLLDAVDDFVFYDDVNFIKGGWINRNKILVNSQANLFTIPLKKSSSFKLIKETELNHNVYSKWKIKFLKTIQQSYKKAPYFENVFPIIKEVIDREYSTISEMTIESVKSVSKYLNQEVNFYVSSESFADTKDNERADRLIQIAKKMNSSNYINSYGGRELYSKEYFEDHDIKLNFIKPKIKEYGQFRTEFTPNLSIIDLLMFANREELSYHLKNYELI